MTPDVTVSAAMAPAEKTSEAVDHPATQLLRCYRTRDARGTVRTALNHWHSPIIHDHEEKRSMLMAESLESAPVLDYPLSLAFALSTEAMPHFCYANAWHVFNSLAN